MGFRKIKKNKNTDRIFLDRDDIFELLQNDVYAYLDTNEFYMLYAFYGMGGIGKSRLVKQIYELYNGGPLQTYKIPLEILNQQTIPVILFFISNFFSYTPHFEYALFRYWDFINYDRINRESFYNIIKKSELLVAEIADKALFKYISPLKPSANFLIEQYEKRDIQSQERQYVTKLLQGKIEKLYQYMTQKLAEDIEKELEKDKYLFIFDAYNISDVNTEFDWLYDFINTFQKGMFIVTSRESLKWFEGGDADQSLYKNIPLESIPETNVKNYLLEQGYTKKQINIIESKTDCVPLFLDIVLNSYTKEEINENTFVGFSDKKDIIEKFLDHLSREEQNIIEYLSAVSLFNKDIYNHALDFNKLSYQQFSFADFKESTIVRYVEEFNGLYKIHSVLAHNIALLIKSDVYHRIIIDYVQFIWARILNNNSISDDVKYNFIVNVYSLIKTVQILLDTEISEKMIDMYFYLYDRSYERDFANYISEIPDKESDSLKYIYKYIEGKAVRLSSITQGLKILENIPIDKCGFGKHKKTLQCDINYLLSISGQYNKAETKMYKFVKSLNENEKGERYYAEGIIYDCDMKMLRGKFKSSVEGLLELENTISDSPVLFEIYKAIGHNYRFNFFMESAMDYYEKCSENEKSAYYYTICCETFCYFEPQSVLDIYKDAKSENQKYNNHNNLGKIYYSMAIAYILKSDYILAQKYIDNSKAEFKKTKYRAGNIFVMITQAYLEYSQTKKISSQRVKEIVSYMDDLDNIYEYLLLPIYVSQDNITKIEEYRNKFEWFSYDETIENIKKFIAQL